MFQSNGLALLQSGQEIGLDVPDGGVTAQPYAVFKVQEQAAVVHVHRAHGAELVVHGEVLGVDEAGRVLVDLHPRLQQGVVVGPGDLKDDLLVRDVGGQDAHIHPRLGGNAQSRVHAVVHDEVGRGKVDIPPGTVDEVEVDRLAHRLPVQRAVGVGLDVALPLHRRLPHRPECVVVPAVGVPGVVP